MSPLFQCERFTVYEPIDDDESRALESFNNGLIYYLQFNHAMFQSVTWRERMIMICSKVNLQITPPNTPYAKCLLEVIGKLQTVESNIESDLELSQDELTCISELPTGWKLSELYAFDGYRSDPLPQINYEMQRLCWYVGAPEIADTNCTLFIHPQLDRPLTGLEWGAIEAASGDTALLGWLGWLASRPSSIEGQEGAIVERIDDVRGIVDLRQLGRYPALTVYPYSDRRMRLFNVDDRGQIKVDWSLISNRNQGRLTYEPIKNQTETARETD